MVILSNQLDDSDIQQCIKEKLVPSFYLYEYK